MKLPIHVEVSGRVVGAETHDGYLRELTFVDGDCLRLLIVKNDQREIEVTLHGLIALSIVEFRNGAIVADIFQWAVKDTNPVPFSFADNPWKVLLGQDVTEAEIAAFQNKLSRENSMALLIQVNCSYGGSMAAVCETLSARRIAPQ